MPDALDELKPTDETAKFFRLHPDTLRRMYREGRVPAYKCGRSLLFDIREVAETFRSTPPAGSPARAAEPNFDAIGVNDAP